LTLTPATDPRIASINFPCGDLSAATTFVVTDTAILAGTNEIGGIYVGLATNMANVAQAEFVGSIQWAVTANCIWTSTNTAYSNFAADADCDDNARTVNGNLTDVSVGQRPAFSATLKPGRYQVIIQGSIQVVNNAAQTDAQSEWRLFDGTSQFGPSQSISAKGTASGVGGIFVPTMVFDFDVATTTSGTFDFQSKPTGATLGTTRVDQRETNLKISVYRFPSSSELVVTPERQNTWGGVVYDDSAQNVFYGTMAPTAFTSYNDATWNKPTKLKGKASVTTTNTGNDLGFSVDQLPVGNYKVTLTNGFYTDPGLANGNAAICIFRVRETTTNTIIGRIQLSGTRLALFNVTHDGFGVIDGVFTQTSLGQRNFILEASKQADTSGSQDGQCVTTTNQNILSFTITPLDQPSNSALYVQGPVLGAQTGAAIPAGYVGEKKTVHIGSETNVPSSGAWYNIGNMTLTTGVWSCTLNGLYEQNGANFTSVGNALFAFSDAVAPSGPAYTYQSQGATAGGIWPTSFVYGTLSIPPMVLLSNGSQITWPDGVTRGTTTLHVSGFLSTYTAGTPRYLMRAECTRLN
jgi:hypothetical protein